MNTLKYHESTITTDTDLSDSELMIHEQYDKQKFTYYLMSIAALGGYSLHDWR